MSWEQRNADFCKAQLDAEFVYIEAERRVKALEDENAKLRELVAELYEDQCDDCDKWRYRDRMRELGIEVG